MWLPDLLFALFGIAMLVRLERPGDLDILGRLMALFRLIGRAPRALKHLEPKMWLTRFSLLPQVVDTYVLTSFLFYFVLLLTSFVLMTHVFTFFELLSDIIKNHPAMSRVLSYHMFLL